MRFNSVTGRAALSARGGHVFARKYRNGVPCLRRAAYFGRLIQWRKRLPIWLERVNEQCIRSTGLSSVVVAREYELGRLDQLVEELNERDRKRYRR